MRELIGQPPFTTKRTTLPFSRNLKIFGDGPTYTHSGPVWRGAPPALRPGDQH